MKLNKAEIAKIFGYKNANTFYNSSKKRVMVTGVERVIELCKEESESLRLKLEDSNTIISNLRLENDILNRKIDLLSSNISTIEKSLKELEFIKISNYN